jgi:excisionase family DNA binding protein
VTRGTVYHWIDAGRLQAVRLGGAVRVLRASYDAFVQQATTSQEAR